MLAASREVKKTHACLGLSLVRENDVIRKTATAKSLRFQYSGRLKLERRRADDTKTHSEIRGWSPRRSIIQDYVASRRVCSPDDARKHKRAGKCDGEEEERWERERWEAEERERRWS